MEHNGENENLPSTLCRSGCGFYASASFEGMCSKCYKESVKRRQQNSSPTPTCLGGSSMPLTASSVAASLVSEASAAASVGSSSSSSVETKTSAANAVDTGKRADVDTATPTVPSATALDKTSACEASTDEKSAESATASGGDSPSDKDKKPKKNRCHSCKKKVGLTGFECRCGGLYCSVHRYSDKHDCTFNYKELAQRQIRKNNPVVVGQKIQKI